MVEENFRPKQEALRSELANLTERFLSSGGQINNVSSACVKPLPPRREAAREGRELQSPSKEAPQEKKLKEDKGKEALMIGFSLTDRPSRPLSTITPKTVGRRTRKNSWYWS